MPSFGVVRPSIKFSSAEIQTPSHKGAKTQRIQDLRLYAIEEWTPQSLILFVTLCLHVFEFFPEIKQFQVIQDNIESITIRYIPGVQIDFSVIAKIQSKFIERTQSTILINWEEVENIEASKSGKPQLIINNLLAKSLADTL